MKTNNLPHKPGIYAIRHCASSKVYVGSAENLHRRAQCHVSELRWGKHHNPHLQKSWDRYGREAFAFDILEIVECLELLRVREQFFIDQLFACDNTTGYNMEPSVRVVLSTDSRDKLATSIKGSRTMSEETKRKIAAALIGRKAAPFSDEHRRRISAALKGIKRSPEHCRKISESAKKRDPACFSHKHSEESRNHMSAIKNKTSGHRGVRASASKRNPWQAYVFESGKFAHVGVFPSIDAAVEARRQFLLRT